MEVKETRAKCNVCGHIWHYKWTDRHLDVARQIQTIPCLLLFQPKPKVETSRCPKCGSSAISRKNVVHNIDV